MSRAFKETFLVEFRPIVRLMYESEDRQKTTKSKNFRLLGVSGFWCNKPDDWKGFQICFTKCNVADCHLDEGNQNCSYREATFRKKSWTMFSNNLVEVLDNQDFDARNIMNAFSMETSLTWVKLTNETLLEHLGH